MREQSYHIVAIAAMSDNRVIGKENRLPWHLPADLKHFKQLTTSHRILMGRKTYESIGKPLPNRENIILTQQKNFSAPGCVIIHEFNDALKLAKEDDLYVIGGANIYRQFLPIAHKIFLTVVHHEFEGDVFFPELEESVWERVQCENHPADEKNFYPYSFLEFTRKLNK